MKRRILVVAGAFVLACAAAHEQPVATSRDASVAPSTLARVDVAEPGNTANEPSVIGRVRMRDATLTMLATGHGPRFALTARDGTPIESGMDESALAARHPEVHAVYRSAVAQQPFLDARLDLPETRGENALEERAPRR